MPDIFISYAREDRPRAKELARALERCGWEVWWDEHIRPGDHFDRAIEQTLPQSTCVVVLWSSNSVGSDFVRSEARWAAKNGRLVPIFIDHVDLPIEFSAHQTIDLVGWPCDETDGFYRLVADLGQRIGRGEPPKTTAPQHRSTGVTFWSIGVAVLGLLPYLIHIFFRFSIIVPVPIFIGIGLLVLALVKPIAPRTALVSVIVPYVLYYFTIFLASGERGIYHFTS